MQVARIGLMLALVMTLPNPASAQEFGNDPLPDLLPDGRSAVRLETRFGVADHETDGAGNSRPLFYVYDNVTINSAVLPSLALFGAGASLGTTHLAVRASGERYRLTWGYGVSKDLNLGITLPWGHLHTDASLTVTGANLMVNPLYNATLAVSAQNLPFLPTAPLTPQAGAQNLQQVLSDPRYGYNYRRVESYDTTVLLDPLIGARWRFQSGPGYSTLFAPSLRIGMAPKPDANNLLDIPVGEGNDALKLGMEHIRNLNSAFDLRLWAEYTVQGADRVTARARSVTEGIVPVSRTEDMDRRMGNAFDASAELGYRAGDWRLSAKLESASKDQDKYTSARGQDVSGLEAHTAAQAVDAWLGATWSGLRAYEAGQLALPIIASLQFNQRLSGQYVYLTQYIYLTVTAVF